MNPHNPLVIRVKILCESRTLSTRSIHSNVDISEITSGYPVENL